MSDLDALTRDHHRIQDEIKKHERELEEINKDLSEIEKDLKEIENEKRTSETHDHSQNHSPDSLSSYQQNQEL